MGASFISLVWSILRTEGLRGLLWRRNVARTLRGTHPYVHDVPQRKLITAQYRWRRFIKRWSSPTASDESLKFSFLVDARFQSGEALLRGCGRQLAHLHYRNWDCLVAVTVSGRSAVEDAVRRCGLDASKCIFHVLPDDLGPAAALNHLLNASTANYFHVVQPNCELYPQALSWLAGHLASGIAPAVVYGDEDCLDAGSADLQPVFKPSFGEALLWQEYGLGKAAWFHLAQVRQASGFDEALRHGVLWDLCWRLLERYGRSAFLHVPQVLLLSTGYVQNAEGRYEILSRHVGRSAPELGSWGLSAGNSGRVWESAGDQPLVSIVIPTRDRCNLLAKCVESLLEITRYTHMEIVVIDNDSEQPETLEYLDQITTQDARIKVIKAPGTFNFSRLNNLGVAACSGEFVLLLNNDIEITRPDWLLEMVFWVMQPEVGCVGAKLWYPDGRLQHGGVAVGVCGVAAHLHRGTDRADQGYLDRLIKIQNVSAVTGACLLVRRDVYEEVGGLDEVFAVTCNDIDFCLRVAAAGYINVWTPFAELIHHESASRGVDSMGPQRSRLNAEVAIFRSRWVQCMHSGDPFYSPNLTRLDENCSLRLWGSPG